MIAIQKKLKLDQYTTFQIGGVADFFVVVSSLNDLMEAISWAKKNKQPLLFLGGGSNTLISDRGWRGLVIKNEIKGIKKVKENDDFVWLKSSSGEWWSSLVNFAVLNNYYGAENLFLIPGTVGAAPMQNIGAYGVELKDIFAELEALEIKSGRLKKFTKKSCQFAYRFSVFKGKLKNKYFIVSVTLKLNKIAKFKLDYGDIKQVLEQAKILSPNARQVVDAISTIRNSKLPNPSVLPNAGSFFKNPEISLTAFNKLVRKFPDIKFFKTDKGIKIPAGWLIESCGFKGKTIGRVGVYEKQALIIVNHGGARASQIIKLADKIVQAVYNKFNIKLEKEINYIK
ncbi:MAG: UDP-N-acetylmuramate dehydrogenase [Patescibacteria group bacterium]|jgi:UDP-N-acetylmuramate dehydrogenase